MRVLMRDLINQKKRGIYSIQNLKTGRYYIGSVSSEKSCFKVRCIQHFSRLNAGTHENSYLQRSFNKHKELNFQFQIIEVLEKDILETEQKYLDSFFEETYNLNPFATKPPCYSTSSKETRIKQLASRRKFTDKAFPLFYKVKNGEILLESVSKEYRKFIAARLDHIPWNKGLTKENTDFSYLKGVSKTTTLAFKQGRIDMGITQRKKSKPINVYDYEGNFIKTFRSASDVVDYTREHHDLPLILKSEKGRIEKPYYQLEINNILKVLRGAQKQHKGLIFRYKGSDIPIIPLEPKDIFVFRKSFDQCYFYKKK